MLDPLPTIDEFAEILSERANKLTPPPEIPFHVLQVDSPNDMDASSEIMYLPDGQFVVHFERFHTKDEITCSTAQEAAEECVKLTEKYYGDKPGEITSLFITRKTGPVSNPTRY